MTEADGPQTKGKVHGVANGFLSIESGSTTKTFAQTTVASITRRDSGIEGLLIGAGAGAAAALVFIKASCSSSGSECAAIATPLGFLTMVPGGMVAGFLIDKYTGGDRVYRAPGARKASIAILPALGKHAGGVKVMFRF